MTSPRSTTSVSRRAALAGLGAGSLGLAVAASARPVSAQGVTASTANHPIVGTWNVMTPGGPAPGIFFADGTVLIAPQPVQAGPEGVTFVSAQPGTWEPVSERGIHFTGVQIHCDADGVYTGAVTIDGYPVVGEDGTTLLDDQSQGKITVRDATGAIVQEMPTAGAPPVTGTRIGVGAPGFAVGAPAAATPEP